MKAFELLTSLQEKYNKISENNKILKDGSDTSNLKKLKVEFTEIKSSYLGKEAELSKVKSEYEKINDEINANKKLMHDDEYNLYHNSGSDLKLIQKLEISIENLRKAISESENKGIDLLEAEEKLSSERQEIRNKLVQIKEDFDKLKQVSNDKVNSAKENLIKAQNEVEELKKQIPSDLLKIFEDISQRKTAAVASLQGGVCSGCKMKVSKITLDEISKGIKIVCCDNCGRILYINDSALSSYAK